MSDHVTVIPVFNEAATIGGVGQRAALPGPVTVVDDGSWDGSDETAAAAGAVILRTGGRLGKGGALRLGFAGALARTAERVVTLDGDGQHDPDDIPRLLAASEPEPDALVIGGRLSGGGSLMEPARLHALRVASFFINWLTGQHIADTQSGFRVYPRELLERVSPRGGGFVFETEVLVRAAAAGYAIREVSISSPRPASRPSRFRPLRDGVAVTGYLAVQGLRRWASDAGLVARALARPFTAGRRGDGAGPRAPGERASARGLRRAGRGGGSRRVQGGDFPGARGPAGGGGRARGLPALPHRRVAPARQPASPRPPRGARAHRGARLHPEVRRRLPRPGVRSRVPLLLPGRQALAGSRL